MGYLTGRDASDRLRRLLQGNHVLCDEGLSQGQRKELREILGWVINVEDSRDANEKILKSTEAELSAAQGEIHRLRSDFDELLLEFIEETGHLPVGTDDPEVAAASENSVLGQITELTQISHEPDENEERHP